MAFSKAGFGVLAGGFATRQHPKIFFFSRPLSCSFYRVGRESDACSAGLSDFEKAIRRPRGVPGMGEAVGFEELAWN